MAPKRNPPVHNSAGLEDTSAGNEVFAATGRPLNFSHPARIRDRSRRPSAALRPTSKRTPPREGSCIRATHGQRQERTRCQKGRNAVNAWTECPYFAGVDWGHGQHQLVVVDRGGQIVESLRFDHTAEGWEPVRRILGRYPEVPLAIETNQGLAIEQLLPLSVRIYPVNPQAAEQYRRRKAPSGAKDDELDAWSLADALRVDGNQWRPLLPDDPLTIELRLLCRDEVTLIAQRTGLVNQLVATLREYYPVALQAFEQHVHPAFWDFVLVFPDPAALAAAGRRKWQNFLHAHQLYRPQTAEHRLALFAHPDPLPARPAVVAAKRMLAQTLARMLRTLQAQLDAYRARIEKLFQEHPDHQYFGSLPGAGPKIAPRLLSELGDRRERFDSAASLQAYGGAAPITVRSGGDHRPPGVYFRHACNTWLRYALHQWADLSRRTCPWAEAYYQAHRQRGQSHAAALRCLATRWTKILWRMWQDRTPYDPERHLRNQIQHGSWVIRLTTPAPQPTPATA